MSDEKKKSPKTTWYGIVGAVGVLCIGLSAFFDGNPDTVADTAGLMQAIGTLLSAVGLGSMAIAAKDNDQA